MGGGILDLIVTVRYHGRKARNFYPNSSQAVNILREDLVTLKLPHPKVENITITGLPNGKGECTFKWPNIPKNSVLHKHLSTRIYGRDIEETRKTLLNELSIDQLALKEVPVPSFTFKNKTWRKSDATQASPKLQQGLRTEAQLLLDDMASALKIPKSEPVEPTIPDASLSLLPRVYPPRDLLASSQPSPLVPPPQTVATDVSDYDSPMSISSSRQSTPRPIKTLPISPVIPPLTLTPPQDLDFAPPGLTISTQNMGRHSKTQVQLPSPTMTTRKRSHSHSPTPWARRPAPSGTTPSATGGTVQARVNQLTRELWDVRRQITAGVAREATIMSEISSLDTNIQIGTKTSLEDSAMRARLKTVQEELEQEKRLKVIAEEALADFKRECKEPFVVPAMLDAFLMISKLTSQITDPTQTAGTL